MEVSDEVAQALTDDLKYEENHQRSRRRNSTYSHEFNTDTEKAEFACESDDPAVQFEMKELYCNLCQALNSLSDIQGKRIDAHYIIGMSETDIASNDGVSVSAVCSSINLGIQKMRNFLNSPQKRLKKCAISIP